MSFISELAARLETEGHGTVGTDIFIGKLPREKESLLSLIERPFNEADKDTGIKYDTVDFWARNKSAASGHSKLEDIFNEFDRKGNWDLTNYFVYFAHPLGNIEDMDEDSETRKLWRLTVRFIYRDKNIV